MKKNGSEERRKKNRMMNDERNNLGFFYFEIKGNIRGRSDRKAREDLKAGRKGRKIEGEIRKRRETKEM